MKPIIFNTDMVRAILDGQKTVTRRVVKPHYRDDECGFHILYHLDGRFERVEVIDENELTTRWLDPPYSPGDILWVRETWNGDWCDHYIYKADGGSAKAAGYAAEPKWRPSIHMPREAARLFLRVTGVRVERLCDITITDLQNEGIVQEGYISQYSALTFDYFEQFRELWNRTVKPADRPIYGWDANPWVFVIEFERISKEQALEGGGE